VREQVPIARPDGPRVWEIAAISAGDAATPAVVMEIRDVTEEALSLRVKTDFVANASHELRTPIASMRMALETLTGLGDDDGAMRDRLMSMLTSNVARMEEMVRDLMDLSRLESPEAGLRIETVKVSEVADDLRLDFQAACAQRGLRLAFDLDPALEALRTDRMLLGLVLGNLIDNATKFAFEGSEVRVVGRPIGGAEGAARGVRFEVIDQGVGIPLEQQARIFERYYQVDEARDGARIRRGTGLGLAIVKHAVRRLGGSVRVQSIWHQGTTMTVELPGALPAT
jgi:signal transduction histidine kinase